MNKFLIALSLLPLSISAEELSAPNYDKSGFTLQIGASKLGGDMGFYGIGPNGETVGVSFGGSYTSEKGVILGGLYTPTVASDAASSSAIAVTLEIDSLSLFGGYQFDNNIRLTGGLTISEIEGYVASKYYGSASASERNSGFNIGLGYEFNNGLSLEGRFATLDLVGISGSTMNIVGGYKF